MFLLRALRGHPQAATLRFVALPEADLIGRMDRVDYQRRRRSLDPAAFVRELDAAVGATGEILLVQGATDYGSPRFSCAEVAARLDRRHGPREVLVRPDVSTTRIFGWLVGRAGSAATTPGKRRGTPTDRGRQCG